MTIDELATKGLDEIPEAKAVIVITVSKLPDGISAHVEMVVATGEHRPTDESIRQVLREAATRPLRSYADRADA